MQLKMKIKNCKSVNVVYGMLLFVIFERLLESIGFPHVMVFFLDIANLYLLLNMSVGHKLSNIFATKMIKIHILVFIIAIITAWNNGISIACIIWALRNLLRFYVFFGACISYLKQEDVVDFYSLMEKLFYVNSIIIFIQYLMGYRMDYLGGLFGTTTGANAYNNIFMLLVCTYTVAKWFEKRERISKTVFIVFLSFIITIITETKVFLFEIIIVVVLNFIIISIVERRYMLLLKGTLVAMIVAIGSFLGARYIASIYPNISNSNLFSIEGLKYILMRDSGYTGYGDLNRLTALFSINKLDYFKNLFSHRLFGMGLGGAEYSSLSTMLQSEFYSQYEYLHYYWFSHAWMYLECGYIGLFGYVMGFFFNATSGVKIIRKMRKNKVDSFIVVTGVVISIMSFMLYIYNQTLRLESAYLIYFAFAAIFIGDKEVFENGKSISQHNSTNV